MRAEHEVEEDLPAREVEDAEGVSGQGGQQQHADHCRAADDDAVDDELLHNLPGKAVVLPVERKGECKGLADELRDGLEGDEEGHEKGRDRADEKESQDDVAPPVAAQEDTDALAGSPGVSSFGFRSS